MIHQQLLNRSRLLPYKSPNKWSESQKERASILFEEYPEIKKVYFLSQKLRNMYNNNTDKTIAITKLAHRYNDVENLGNKSFNTIMNNIKVNYDSIFKLFWAIKPHINILICLILL